MNLSDLTLDELVELQAGLSHIETAVRALMALDRDVVVSLTDEDTVITAAPVLLRCHALPGDADDPGPVLIEDDPQVPGMPIGTPPAPSVTCSAVAPVETTVCPPEVARHPAPVAPLREDWESAGTPRIEDSGMAPSDPVSAGRAAPAAPAATAKRSWGAANLKPGVCHAERVIGADGKLRGPYTENEDSTIVHALARGQSFAELAAALNRTEAALKYRARKVLQDRIAAARAELAERAARHEPKTPAAGSEAPQNAPAHAGAAGAPASCQTPNGDAGQAPATEAAPPPAAPSPGVDPSAVPEDFRGEARALWMRYAALKPDPGFDADLDRDLVEGLGAGRKLAELALDFGIDAAGLKRRWEMFRPWLVNDRGHVRPDAQAALLSVLRRRVALDRGIAA